MNEAVHRSPSPGATPTGVSAPGRWPAALFSLALMGLVLAPVAQNWRTKPRDDFPLSYYPMFSENREPTVRVTYFVGIDAQGGRHRLPYTFAGGGGLNQVRRQINRRLDRDQEDTLCREVAGRVARGKGWVTNIVSVEIVTGTYHLGGYFTGTNRAPVQEKLQGSCRVRRGKEG